IVARSELRRAENVPETFASGRQSRCRSRRRNMGSAAESSAEQAMPTRIPKSEIPDLLEFRMDLPQWKTSWRTFLKRSAAAGAYLMGPRGFATSSGNSAIVVGAGAFGGWTALELLRKGAKVTLLDAWGPGNSRASSGGETRIIRGTYGAGRIYTEMTARALQ